MRIRTVFASAILALSGCGGERDPVPQASPASESRALPYDCVDMSADPVPLLVAIDNEFRPVCLGIADGQDLTMQNRGALPHTFTLPEGTIRVMVQPGENAVVQGLGDAVPPGEEVVFRCQLHPEMVGYLNLIE